jgi:hypothetical protein
MLARANPFLGFWIAGLLTLSVVASSCGQSGVSAKTGLPPELLVPSSATSVKARSERDAAAVEFELAAPYPATEFLGRVGTHLQKLGWRPTESDFLNPEVPSSHVRGWTYFYDRTASPPGGVHQWLGDWRNGAGDWVSYALRYSSPSSGGLHEMAAPTTGIVKVTAIRVPSATAKAMAASAGRRGERP